MDLTPSFLYRIAADGWKFLRGLRRSLSNEEVVRLREKWQPVFDDRIAERRRDKLREDVIIRDVRRVDVYPELPDKERISNWFRVGLVGTYHRGIQVGLRIEGLCFDEQQESWRYVNYKANEESELTAYLLGDIRFENIESVQWDGDEYYGYPHIYCHFVEKAKQPYEKLAFYEQKNNGYFDFYTQVATLDEVQKYSEKLRAGPYAE